MWAHSLNAAGVRHSLADHLYGTAELAGGFAAAFGARDAGYFLGLAHDAGKASCRWQEGLAQAEKTGRPVGVDHKTLGVYLAARRGLEIAQFALHGHHGGLTCRDHIGRKMRGERADGGERRRAEIPLPSRPPRPAPPADTPPVASPPGARPAAPGNPRSTPLLRPRRTALWPSGGHWQCAVRAVQVSGLSSFAATHGGATRNVTSERDTGECVTAGCAINKRPNGSRCKNGDGRLTGPTFVRPTTTGGFGR